jgi:transcriptional regulator of aromatic amino acid metabolism
MSALERYHWPGNIAELKSEIYKATSSCKSELIQAGDLHLKDSGM